MKCLAFSRARTDADGRRIRTAMFEERSSFPVSAACVVANGVREQLARLFDGETTLTLCEPAIPPPHAWTAIARDARCFRVRGPLADAAFVLRPRDAVALATAAFGVTEAEERPLSTIERGVLERAVHALAGALTPACGVRGGPAALEPVAELAGFTTYFELHVERPARMCLGIALSREPKAVPGPSLRIEDLMEVDVELRVGLSAGHVPAEQIAGLQLGAIVPITHEKALVGSLALAGTVLARGECGVRSGRYALAVNESI